MSKSHAKRLKAQGKTLCESVSPSERMPCERPAGHDGMCRNDWLYWTYTGPMGSNVIRVVINDGSGK